MKNYSKILRILLAAQILVALSMSSCKKDKMHPQFTSDIESPILPTEDVDNNNGNNNTVQIYSSNKIAQNVIGLVLDESGTPIANADVNLHGLTATTNNNGIFEFYNAQVPENRTYVKVTKSGYFTGSRAFIPSTTGASTVKIMMQSNSPVASIDASIGGIATLSNGAKVEFPADAVMLENGGAYSGSFDVAVKYLDPESADFGFVMPGDLDAVDENGDLVALHSFGMLNVELTGSAGEKLQVASGKQATMTVPVPSSMIADAPNTIPLWWFDEAVGIWKEDGSATLQGTEFVGSVSHFTTWNWDWKGPRAYIEGHVTDCNGNPVAGMTVFTDGESAITDGNGFYSRWVAADPSIIIDVQALDFNGAVSSSIFSVGPLTAGQTVTQDLQVNCLATLDIDIQDCNGNSIAGSIYLTVNGQTGVYNINGVTSIIVPDNANITYFAYGSNGETGGQQSVTSGAQGSVTALNAAACGTSISTNEFVINGGAYTNQLVQFPVALQPTSTYYVNSNGTSIYLYDQAQQAGVSVWFPGNTTGTFATGTTNNFYLDVSYQGVYSDSSNSSFNLNITKYDPVGGLVEGTYSGSWTDFNGVAYTVSGGKLSAIRAQDQ
ncbi:MAG: carboxypeptidase-like regulatory domain-containing protein [Flavobacteriales bacterium]|nr:carboxypeptidase-like regulatory domain-containing protein [Flavobacteriales bacterium]